MALLERVGTLLRANLNDLIDKAEDPEKLLKQLVLDMENQLMQVKTQVAIALADEHLLEKKRREHEDAEAEWKRKAELAVRKSDDGLARAALDSGARIFTGSRVVGAERDSTGWIGWRWRFAYARGFIRAVGQIAEPSQPLAATLRGQDSLAACWRPCRL